MAWVTARPAYRARRFLVARLAAFHREHGQSLEASVAHRINAIAMSSPGWRDDADYYRCELLEALGLLATASTLSAWLVRHLLAEPGLRRRVVEQVRRLATDGATGRPDLGDVRASCPHLAAAWYETLRLHVTVVPRMATAGFALPVPSRAAPVAVREGDVLLLPMLSSNLDAKTWGPDAAAFSAERFLDAARRLDSSRARRVRGFGVAGNLCPGRSFGFDAAMAAVATTLRDFDVQSPPCAAPAPRPGLSIGFERLADDVSVRLTRARGG